MKITRMDLDMTGSPMGLVTNILAAEPDLATPTPIEKLAAALDIQEIAELTTAGFEGGLITTEERTSGIILVNKNCTPTRRRFTIAHELGHFLLPTHKPVQTGQFLCKRDDMSSWDQKDQDKYNRMEAEANQFASLILMPPPRLRLVLKRFGTPSISNILTIAEHFQVSPEAAARSYIEYHGDPLAFAITKGNIVIRSYKSREFPYITVRNGALIPAGSNVYRSQSSGALGCDPLVWVDQPVAYLSEQIHRQGEYAMILLRANLADEQDLDEEEDMTSAERLKYRQWRRSGL